MLGTREKPQTQNEENSGKTDFQPFKGEGQMLEGKEITTKVGDYGLVSIDVTPDLKIRMSIDVEVDLIAEAKKLAAKTETPIDDAAIAWLEKILKAEQSS